MKKIITVLALLLAAGLTACDNGAPEQGQTIDIGTIAGNVTRPGNVSDLASPFLVALNCATGKTITWTYTQASITPYDSAIDGSITQTGIFTAPKCGSRYVGTTVTVQASCQDANNVTHTGTANIAVTQDLLNSIVIAAASVSACGAAPCLAHTPTNITVPLCTGTDTTTIQFYSQLEFTCGVFWNPADPPTVGTGAGQQPQCSTAISP